MLVVERLSAAGAEPVVYEYTSWPVIGTQVVLPEGPRICCDAAVGLPLVCAIQAAVVSPVTVVVMPMRMTVV